MRSKLHDYDEEFSYKWNMLVNKSSEHSTLSLKLVGSGCTCTLVSM